MIAVLFAGIYSIYWSIAGAVIFIYLIFWFIQAFELWE